MSYSRYRRIATPIARGRKPTAIIPMIQDASEIGPLVTIETLLAIAATVATDRNHFICWRSTPRDRRNRATRLAQTRRNTGGARRRLREPSVWIRSDNGFGGTTGLTIVSKLPIVPGAVAVANTPIDMATMAIPATIRQRGPGRCPVG